jgi:hypothetical protein
MRGERTKSVRIDGFLQTKGEKNPKSKWKMNGVNNKRWDETIFDIFPKSVCVYTIYHPWNM